MSASKTKQITTNQLPLFPHIGPNPVDKTIERNAIKFYTEKVFSIEDPIARKYYKQYFLVYWRGSFILDQSSNTNGTISRKTSTDNRIVQYKIVYKTPLTRGKILARLDDQFALSFREPFPEFNIQPVVIVSFSNRQYELNRERKL